MAQPSSNLQQNQLPTFNTTTNVKPSTNTNANTGSNTNPPAKTILKLPDNIDALPDHGYPQLADMMGRKPGTAMFRRFKTLSMLNLLRMQAELHDLEHQLWKTIKEDRTSQDKARKRYSSDFRVMRDWVEQGDSEQSELLDTIATKLHAYETAVDRLTRMKDSERPTKRELAFLQEWLDSPAGGNSFLRDREGTIYSNSNASDFVSLQLSELEGDPFTSFLNGRLLDLYHRTWGDRKTTGAAYREYGADKIDRLSKIIASVIGSVLPTITILVLFFVHPMLNRIAVMIVFTAVFSVTLALFTDVTKVDIFTATSTFAAVEVVFIGSTSFYHGGNGTASG